MLTLFFITNLNEQFNIELILNRYNVHVYASWKSLNLEALRI